MNKHPSPQQALWCLGYQETKKVSTQSILMDYLLKCIQTQQSLGRPEAAMHSDEKESGEKVCPSTLRRRSQERKNFCGTQRLWVWISPHLIQKSKGSSSKSA